MGVYVSVPKINTSSILFSGAEGANEVFGAIIAGVILYLINKSFLNNFPAYVSIIVGFVMAVYLGRYFVAESIGFALMADGFYKLIKQYITVSS
jgi:hypothetical protein